MLATAWSTGCGSSSSDYVDFPGSVNGAVVLDANGNTFHFSSSNGCMTSTVGGEGPEGFCLTDSSGQLQDYGPTNCESPASNADCNAASFGVVLTANPAGSGCIAVLGNGGAGQTTGVNGLSVAAVTGGYTITAETYANHPAAYTTYWSSVIPVCGGDSPYAGDYALTVTRTAGDGDFTSPEVPAAFAIDSGGQIDAEGQMVSTELEGSLDGTAADAGITGATFGNSFYVSSSCGPCEELTYSVTMATQTAGTWTLSGTVSATYSLNSSENSQGTFSAVEN